MAMLYHLVPREMRGGTLLPLNRLRAAHPDLHAVQVAKYRGREGSLRKPVPELGCLTTDCLLLSPVDPAAIRDARLARGLPWPAGGRRFFALDTADLAFTARDTVIWPYRDVRPRTAFDAPEPDLIPWSEAAVAAFTELPRKAGTYLDEVVREGLRPLLFVGIPHVLHRGEIDVRDARIVKV